MCLPTRARHGGPNEQKTSQQLRAEATTNFYGINPSSLLVESVSLTRGGTLTHWQTGKAPSAYRIKGGRPPRSEVERVFRLTDIVAVSPRSDARPGEPDHPLVAALERTAAVRRDSRHERATLELAARAASIVTHDQSQFPDHRVVSQNEHSAAATPSRQQGTHPLAGYSVASAGWKRDGVQDSRDHETEHG